MSSNSGLAPDANPASKELTEKNTTTRNGMVGLCARAMFDKKELLFFELVREVQNTKVRKVDFSTNVKTNKLTSFLKTRRGDSQLHRNGFDETMCHFHLRFLMIVHKLRVDE